LCYTLRFGRELFLDRQSNCSPPIHRSFGTKPKFEHYVNGQNRSMMLANWASFLIDLMG
jgi:hypothetical protein